MEEIRAYFTETFIRVYQAYSDSIADSVLENNRFVSPPFNLNRMTWIKPSFLWMMYRSGWAQKDAGQKRILSIDLTHDGFKKILSQGILSHFEKNQNLSQEAWKNQIKESNVIIQWDPDRDINLNKLDYRTIQIGLRREAVKFYIEECIIDINDITEHVKDIELAVKNKNENYAIKLLPVERIYHP